MPSYSNADARAELKAITDAIETMKAKYTGERPAFITTIRYALERALDQCQNADECLTGRDNVHTEY